MFILDLKIPNPFPVGDSDGKSLWDAEKRITNNKHAAGEIYLGRAFDILHFRLDLTMFGHDHAGPSFRLSVLGLELDLFIYDERHWNYEKGAWHSYENNEEVETARED